MQRIDYFDNKKILITGGGGYLGSKLAVKLADSNARIYLLDINFNSISQKLISQSDQIFKLTADLTNYSEIEDSCKKASPDIIFHFGALLNRERNFSLYDKLYEVNVKGTLNLLQSLRQCDYEGFYFASTSEVYGTKNSLSFNEKMIPSPVSPYSLTKIMAEFLISTFSEKEAKPYTILRIFNFYGSDMPENFFISQLQASLNRNEKFKMTRGEQKRDFLHIEKLNEYILLLSQLNESKNQIINICSGEGIEIRQLAMNIAKSQQKENLLEIGALDYRENEIWEMIGDNTKLKALLQGME